MKLKIMFAFALSGLTMNAFSQDEKTSKSDSLLVSNGKKMIENINTKAFNRTNINPYGNGGFSNLFSNFSISTKVKAGTEGKAEFKSTSHDQTMVWGLSLTQTIDKNEEDATLYNFLDGFSSGSKLGFNFQKKLFIGRIINEKDLSDFKKKREEYIKKNNLGTKQGISFTDVYGKNAVIPTRSSFAFNISAAVARNSYKYTVDAVSLKEEKEVYFSPNFDLSIGFLESKNSSFLINYNYSESFKEAEKVNFLTPLEAMPSVITTKALAFGKPKKVLEHKISLGWKKGLGTKFAIAPSFKYGTNTKTKAFDLPIYFIKSTDDDGKPQSLTGGIRMGYASEGKQWVKFDDGVFLQLMVTAPLDFSK